MLVHIATGCFNMATTLGDIMTVFPIFQACWITFSVVRSAVFYQIENKPFSTTDKEVFYPLALIFIAAGVGLLVQHNSAKKVNVKKSGKLETKTRIEDGSMTYEDDDILLTMDASMSSPLLPVHDGYLHLSA